jgi:hypothetical protein
MRRTIKIFRPTKPIKEIKPKYYYVTDDTNNVEQYLKFSFEEKENFIEVYYENTNDTQQITKFENYKDVLHLVKSLDLCEWTTIEAVY